MLLAFGLFVLTGCERDLNDNFEQDRLVVVDFTAGSPSGPSLKSVGTDIENSIGKILLFGFDASDDFVEKNIISNPSATEKLIISRKVKSLYAIANPSAVMMEAANPSNVAAIMDMVGNFGTAPASPFLMSGNGNVNTTNSNATINFVRSVAKVDFIGNTEFTISNVEVKNTPDKEYVFKQEALAVPPAAGYGVSYSSTIPSVYVTENRGANPTQFVVTGQIDGKSATYTIVLQIGGVDIDIERNSYYKVNITPITETTCTVDVSTIPEWNDVIIDDNIVTISRPNQYEDGIKILAIGNSYSEDALKFLAFLLKDIGVGGGNEANIKVVNAFVGGASLETHALNANNNTPAYNSQTFIFTHPFGFNTSGTSQSLFQLIKSEVWDVIILQQLSNFSGVPTSYDPYLGTLITYVKTHATNPNLKLGWHMTWAYQNGYNNSDFNTYYGGNQVTMYNAICSAVQAKIVTNAAFDLIIPTGTAIQNARTGFGDTLNRDMTHLNDLGCFAASTMWLRTITGHELTEKAIYGLNSEQYEIISESVNAAAILPFQITTIE